MNHISTVRQHLLDQMQALRIADGKDSLRAELDRAKGVSELAQVLVNSAKVEVDYLVATGQEQAKFFAPAAIEEALPPGITGITRHRLVG